MYSERHFRCLEGAGPARPHQPGFAAAAPGGRSRPIPAPGPRGLPGVRTAHSGGAAAGSEGRAPPQPPGLHQPAPCPHPGGLGRGVWHPPLPTPALAPLHLPLWASGPRRVRAIGSPQGFADEARARQQLGGCVGVG